MKEIRRAFRINPKFEIEKIKSIFLEIYYINRYHNSYDDIIFLIYISIMDFYSIL